MSCLCVGLLLSLAASSLTMSSASMRWEMSRSDLMSAYNLRDQAFLRGVLRAQTAHDPILNLSMRGRVIAASECYLLTVRAWMSPGDDSWELVYRSPDGT